MLRPSDGAAPVVLQLTDVRLAAGFGHACAVAGGALHCWGDDGDGQLGVASRGRRHRAGAGDGLGRAVDRARGGQPSTPARWPADGGVWCWGGNDNGQLGLGDRTSRPDPRQVALPAKAVDVRTAFEFTCALLADASVWCWGYNLEGQLGSATPTPATIT